MEQVIATIVLGLIAALPGILTFMAQRKRDIDSSVDSFASRLQADNIGLREENRKLRKERDELELKLDELQLKLAEARDLLREVQFELEKYKKPLDGISS